MLERGWSGYNRVESIDVDVRRALFTWDRANDEYGPGQKKKKPRTETRDDGELLGVNIEKHGAAESNSKLKNCRAFTRTRYIW